MNDERNYRGLLRDPLRSEVRRKTKAADASQFFYANFCLQASLHRNLHKKTQTFSGLGFSPLVTAQGFEPRTSASVVRCSIQLSYAAMQCFAGANIRFYFSLKRILHRGIYFFLLNSFNLSLTPIISI